eukprot:CAMPEP_0172443776 /NCGR_PEP_ID=MMETSP1065-20121228/3983_1 /TAXON_ID=265537 /ORGANISM="Amphiprora paludosa, Strain CCMP125" /LENGTH=580 /DNA_ID=CAMNT_0013194113 /DNA_START=68 /DNA_END=1810 /DNA_ORIENTATION=+
MTNFAVATTLLLLLQQWQPWTTDAFVPSAVRHRTVVSLPASSKGFGKPQNDKPNQKKPIVKESTQLSAPPLPNLIPEEEDEQATKEETTPVTETTATVATMEPTSDEEEKEKPEMESSPVATSPSSPRDYESEFAISSVGVGGTGTYNQAWLTTPARASAGLDDCMMDITSGGSSAVGAPSTSTTATTSSITESNFATSSVGLGGSGTYGNGWLTTPARASAGLEDCMMEVGPSTASGTTSAAATTPRVTESNFATSSVGLGGSGTYGNGWLTTPSRTSAGLEDCMMEVGPGTSTLGSSSIVPPVRRTESNFATSSVGLGGSGTYGNGWLTTPARASAGLDDCMMTVDRVDASSEVTAPETTPVAATSEDKSSSQKNEEQATTEAPTAETTAAPTTETTTNITAVETSDTQSTDAATPPSSPTTTESTFATSSVGVGGTGTYGQAWLETPARLSANLDDAMMEVGPSDASLSATPSTRIPRTVSNPTESDFATSSVGLGGSGTYGNGWLTTPARLSANLDDAMMTLPMLAPIGNATGPTLFASLGVPYRSDMFNDWQKDPIPLSVDADKAALEPISWLSR